MQSNGVRCTLSCTDAADATTVALIDTDNDAASYTPTKTIYGLSILKDIGTRSVANRLQAIIRCAH